MQQWQGQQGGGHGKKWREEDLLHLLPGHRVKGESELLLPQLFLPVTVSWTNSESIFQKPCDRGLVSRSGRGTELDFTS